MSRHTKLFYRVIARIRAVGNKNGYVSVTRIKTELHAGYTRAGKLLEELIKASVLKRLDENHIKNSANGGNILWENLSKYHNSSSSSYFPFDRTQGKQEYWNK